MIFGEYLGEVVSNGEYEVRAQGTTNASLKDAIKSLTFTEYLDSFIVINDASYSGLILKPTEFTNDLRIYMMGDYSPLGANIPAMKIFAMYTISTDTLVVRRDNVMTNPSLTGNWQSVQMVYGQNPMTLTSWTLYTRKQTLSVPGAELKGVKDSIFPITPITNSYYAIDTTNTTSVTFGNMHVIYLSISVTAVAGSWQDIGTLSVPCISDVYPFTQCGDVNIAIIGSKLRAWSGTANTNKRGTLIYFS